MRWIGTIRFSMSTGMMLVIAAAAAFALFAKVRQHVGPITTAPGWKTDVPSLFLLAIGLTAIALGAWKSHTAVQMMLQFTLACLGCLVLIWIGEAQFERALRYVFQGAFALTVSLPMLIRRFVKSGMPKGPRRDWWKKTCEAIFFSFLNLLLVSGGGLIQATLYTFGSGFLSKPAPVPVAAPVPFSPNPVPPVPPPAM
jgi:hypothetical protein